MTQILKNKIRNQIFNVQIINSMSLKFCCKYIPNKILKLKRFPSSNQKLYQITQKLNPKSTHKLLTNLFEASEARCSCIFAYYESIETFPLDY